MLVRGWRRGNNARNTNTSPLYVNANNSPSNTNTNIGFGNCNAVTKYISPRLLDLSMKRQVQSLADAGERNNAGKGAKTTSRPRKNERRIG